MITELLQLYERIKFDVRVEEPFVNHRIHWIIDLDGLGNVIGVSPAVSSNSGGNGKIREVLGKEYRCPAAFFLKLKGENEAASCGPAFEDRQGTGSRRRQREVVAAAGGGNVPPELFTGKSLQIFGEEPIIKKDKRGNILEIKTNKAEKGIQKNNHDAFINLHFGFLAALQNHENFSSELGSFRTFLDKKQGIPFGAFASQDLAQLKKDQRFSFRISGRLLFQLPAATSWWRDEIERQRENVLQWLPRGADPFFRGREDCDSALAVRFPHIQGVPGGGGYCPIASFDKVPMQSFGLGELTTRLGLGAAERASAALNWLLKDESTHKLMGDAVFVFWAFDEAAPDSRPHLLDFGDLISEADSLQVREFLSKAWGGYAQLPDSSRFYAAMLSSPQSRVTVRSWFSETLERVVSNFSRWLELSSLTDKRGTELPASMRQLADCTVRGDKNSKPEARTYRALFEAAFFGRPLPTRLFISALQRQSLELAKGCDKKSRSDFEQRMRARTALIKLFFDHNMKGERVTMQNHSYQKDGGYLCGRLLAILDKIHTDAHRGSGGTNSSPANRAYSAASTTPALIFPQLCKLARYHLNKIGGGWAFCLEHGYEAETGEFIEGLKQVAAEFRESAGGSFPRILSLEEQGRFAIGFYFERCRNWPPKAVKVAGSAGYTS